MRRTLLLISLIVLFVLSSFSARAANVFFPVKQGYVDVIPRQIIRTNDDRLYIFAAQAQYSKTLKVYWTNSSGYPNSSGDFSGAATLSDSANIISVETAYDGLNTIHVIINNQAGELKDYPYDKIANSFKSPITIATGNPTVTGDYIGTSGVSAMFDTSNRLQIAYWSKNNTITHTSYSYNITSNVLSITEGPTRIDTSGSANHPSIAVSPADNSLTVAWVSEATTPPKILAKTKSSNGTWGSIETVSTAKVWTSTSSGINIDQGPSIVIDKNGTKHLAYMEGYDSTNDYGRIHYVVNSGGGWVDTAIPNAYTHDPSLAINSIGEIYLLGQGHPNNSSCVNETDICFRKKNADNTWGNPLIFAKPQGSDSYDSSVSVKWSVVGWNKPETIEFLFFNVLNGSYNNTQVMYGRISPSGSVTPTTTQTGTPILTTTNSPSPASCRKDRGDANCDGITNLLDFEDFRKEFNKTLVTKNSDFNNDGVVSLLDFEIWREWFTVDK